MARNIYEAIEPKLLAARWEASNLDREPFLGEAFFKQRKQLSIELSYLKGKKPVIKPLQPSAFDAKVIPLSREAFAKITTEMPFFKNSKNVDEKQTQELLKVVATGNDYYIDSVLNEVYNDQESLLDSAQLRKEMMRMSLLTSGTISFGENGQGYVFDFGVPVGNKVTPTVTWSTAATADPIADIGKWQDQIENATGVRPTELLMNLVTFNYMVNASKVQKAIYAFANNVVTPTREDVIAYVEKATGCRVYIYNKGYTNDAGSFVKFVGDGVVSLFPAGYVGEFVFGTSPEEARLMAGVTKAAVQIVDDGIAITTVKEEDPVVLGNKVSMVCLPTLEIADQIIIADVD